MAWRGQVAQLRAENSHMVSKYNIASRHYGLLTDENRKLRSAAMELSRQLQHLHAAAAQAHPGGLAALGLGGPSHLDPLPLDGAHGHGGGHGHSHGHSHGHGHGHGYGANNFSRTLTPGLSQ
eukprot:SM000054S18126  [mRNA]  locus=s54:679679:680044:+ [translate_table: standard]